jgi:hypothetical protein
MLAPSGQVRTDAGQPVKPGQKVVYIRGELSRLVSNHLNSWKNLSTRVHPVEDLMF